MSHSLQPHRLTEAHRLPHPSVSPGVCSNSCPLSQWRHPTISSSVMPSSSSALSLSQDQDLWSHNDSQMRDLIIGYQGFYRRIGLRDKGVTLIGMMATWKAKISLPSPLSLLQPSITKTSQFSLWDVLGDYHDIHVPLFYEAFFVFFFFFWQNHLTCRVFVPWPQIEPAPPVVEAQSLNHWTTRKSLAHPSVFLPPLPIRRIQAIIPSVFSFSPQGTRPHLTAHFKAFRLNSYTK